jgi:uncharacterized protein
MLIRFLVSNLFSFKETTEFNMLPGRFNRLPHHVYKDEAVDLLKLNATYGANGSGKSNLIKALELLKGFLITGVLPIEFITETFKFDEESRKRDVYLGVEFIKDNVPYYYGITINQGIVVEEELQMSGLGKKNDVLLFKRIDEVVANKLMLSFSDDITRDAEASLFPEFFKNEILERNKPVLFYMKNRHNEVFAPFKQALEWFMKDLITVMPFSKPSVLAWSFEHDEKFREFALDLIQSFKTGISKIEVETIPIEDFFGQDNRKEADRVVSDLIAHPGTIRPFITEHYEEIVFLLEDGKAFAKRLCLRHEEDSGVAKFYSIEESDGTNRLLDYLPILYEAINSKKVYLIDEIERSIHPLLIKELIKKFSDDTETKGQLIFTTHESNLLDQEIFRPDEIWFTEKNRQGATELYPLSEFKEHHTIDIRKGYLNGRYGGIPFLGNLKDLNWDKYAEAK